MPPSARLNWGRARAAATEGLDDGERAPPGGSAAAGAAATGLRDDGENVPSGAGEPIARSGKVVAKRRRESNRLTGSVRSRLARSRGKPLQGGHGGWRGDRGGRYGQAAAEQHQAVGNQRDDAGLRGSGRAGVIYLRVSTKEGAALSAGGPRCRREGERRGWLGWCRGRRSPTSNRPRRLGRKRKQRDQELGEEGFKGWESLKVDGLRGRREKRVESPLHGVASASGARHRREAALGCKE